MIKEITSENAYSYLNIKNNYKTMEETIQNQVLLVETVIMGDVPTTYLEMEKP